MRRSHEALWTSHAHQRTTTTQFWQSVIVGLTQASGPSDFRHGLCETLACVVYMCNHGDLVTHRPQNIGQFSLPVVLLVLFIGFYATLYGN